MQILLIHGMCVTAAVWKEYQDLFQDKGHDVDNITLLYHGESPDKLKDIGILDYARQVQDEIKSLPTKPIIIGHSMGGLIAQKLAEMGLAEKLVLIAPGAPQGIPVVTLSTLLTFSSNVCSIARKKPFIIPFKNATYGLMNSMSHEAQFEAYQQFVYESGSAAYEMARGIIAVDETMVTCPMLVISGSHDRCIPPQVITKVAAKYGARYREYDEHCHLSLIYGQGCVEIAQDILNWIEGKDSKGNS